MRARVRACMRACMRVCMCMRAYMYNYVSCGACTSMASGLYVGLHTVWRC